MSAREVVYKLTDGTTITKKELMEQTGWGSGTCYSRLQKTNERDKLFKPIGRKNREGLKVYTLDDGSVWTARQLAEHLNCKPSTASTRLSMMRGESKRILAPIKRVKEDEDFLNEAEIKERISKRMYEDSTGFWGIFNKMK